MIVFFDINPIINALSTIYAIVLYLSIILGSIFGWILILAEDAKLEKLFKKIVKTTSDMSWIANYNKSVPKHIIISSDDNRSKFRLIIKKLFLRIFYRKKIKNRNIIVIKDEEEKKIRLLEESFSFIPGSDILDKFLLSGLIQYLSYKYSLKNPDDFSNNNLKLIRKNFETSKKGKMIQEMDDPNFDDEIVLNPPPEKRGVLTEVILPLVDYCYQQIIDEGEISPQLIEEKRNRTMELIDGIYNKHYCIIYIGSRRTDFYINNILKNAKTQRFRGFIIGASERYFVKMSIIIQMITPYLKKVWGKDYVDVEEIHGFHEIRAKSYHYLIVRRGKNISRDLLQKLETKKK